MACWAFCAGADGWSSANGTLTYTKDGTDYWKIAPTVSGTSVTLTSQASTIPADGVLDLEGALEAYGLTGTGYALSFAEGSGLSVFASARDVRLGNCPWMGSMSKAAGAPFSGVTNLVVGTLGTDIVFGSGTVNAQSAPLANSVFSTASNLAAVAIYGGNVVLSNACSGAGNLKSVTVRSSGTLDTGTCSFNCGSTRKLSSVKLIAGGAVNLGQRTFRTSLAAGAVVYVEAPSTASVSLDTFAFFDDNAAYWTDLYWNAPAPRTASSSATVWVGQTIVNWHVYNTPALVATWPTMDRTATVRSSANSAIWVRLPADSTDCATEGFWRVNGSDESPYRGSVPKWAGYGAMYWYDTSVGDWSYADGVLTSSRGWKVQPAFSGTTVTLTSASCTPPDDGVLDLAGALQAMGADAPVPLANLSLVFVEGEGLSVFSQVKELRVENCCWLGKMVRQSGAPLTALEKFTVGTLSHNLVFGDYTGNVSMFTTTDYGVFSGTTVLREATILGRDVSLNYSCAGQTKLKKVRVRASGALQMGSCALNSGGYNYNLENVSLVAGGDIGMGYRTFRTSVASNAVIYVEAPSTASVKFDNWTFYQTNVKYPFSFYWNAPSPKTMASSTTPLNYNTVADWYFCNASDLVATFPAMDETNTVASATSSSIYLRLPIDSSDTRTAGLWRVGGSDAAPSRANNNCGYGEARWYTSLNAATGTWSYVDGVLVSTVGGVVRWEIVPSVSKKTLTLTSKNATAAANGVLDLAGAIEAMSLVDGGIVVGTGWVLAFNDAGGAFAQVKELRLADCPWLGRMEKQGGAGFGALEKIVVGSLNNDLVLGNGGLNSQTLATSYGVFPDSTKLGDVTVRGDRLELDDAFAGLPAISNVSVEAKSSLNLGRCSFNDNANYALKRVSFISGGDLDMGWRTTRNGLAANAIVYVEAPADATVKLRQYSFYNGTGTAYPVTLYWNAPKPTVVEKNALASIMSTWYVFNTAALAATWSGMDGTYQNIGQDAYMKLPADSTDTATEGGWAVGSPSNLVNSATCGFYKAYWYAPSTGVNGWSVDLIRQTLTHRNAEGLRDWELVPTADGTTVTLAPEGTGAEVLDLCGAMEAWNASLTGVTLSFASGSGAFANVKELYITNAPWMAKMVRQSGAPLTSLEKFVVDTADGDLVFGDATYNYTAVDRSYGVFSGTEVLRDATICGGRVTLSDACPGQTTLTQVCVRATGSLNMGVCSFNCGDRAYSIQKATLVAGGDLKMGVRTFRMSLAANARVFIEAPSTATVTMQLWTFYQSNTSYPILLYWNAPAPTTDSAQVMNASTDVHWYIYNTPALVATWPTMDGTTFQRTTSGSALMVKLPADYENQTEQGLWCNYGNQTTLTRSDNGHGWGPAYWYNPLPTTEVWSYDVENGLVFTRNGVSRWRFTPTLNGTKLTLTSQEGTSVPMDGRLDLSGAWDTLGASFTGSSVCFAEGESATALAQVKELYLTNCPALTHLDANDGAAFTALEKLVVGTEGQDLVLGSGTANSQYADATTSVFSGATNTLYDVMVLGGNVQLKNAFTGARVLTQAVVKATGTLDTGTCSFSLPKMSLRRAVLQAGGDLTLGDRTFRTAFAKNAKLYVSAPTNATVTLNEYPLHQRDVAKPLSLYWSAPPPTGTSKTSWSYLDMTWYVNADYADSFPEMGGSAVTNQLNNGSIRLSLPANPHDTKTAGFWRCDAGTGAPGNNDNNHGCGKAYWCDRWDVEGRPCRWLSIGNSFSQQMFSSTYNFPNAAKQLGHPLDAASLVKGGCSLLTHWNLRETKNTYSLQKSFTSAIDPFAGLTGADVCLTDVLARVDWDVITIQQVSTDTPDLSTYEPYLGNLVDLFTNLAPHAEIRFQQTWAYDRDCASGVFQFGGDVAKRDAMYDSLRDAIAEVCARYDMAVIPTGHAVQLYRYGLPVRTAAQDFCSVDHRHMGNGQGGNYLQMLTWCMAAFGEMPSKTQVVPPTTPTDFDPDLARVCASNAVMSADHCDYGQGTVDFHYDVTFKGLSGEDLVVESVTNGASARAPDGRLYGLRITGWTPADASVTNTPTQINAKLVYDWTTWYPVGTRMPGTMILLQ